MTDRPTQKESAKKPLVLEDLPTPGQPRDDETLGDCDLVRSDAKKLGRSGDRNKYIGN